MYNIYTKYVYDDCISFTFESEVKILQSYIID